ncbi:MAG: SufD family Fe-S cluster assembly protein [Candidatus Babeliales bacterium]
MSMAEPGQQKLTIYIGATTDETLSLRSLLAEQMGVASFSDLAVSIIIAPSVEVTVCDDVHEELVSEYVRHEIEFVIHRYGVLNYRSSVVTSTIKKFHKNIIVRLMGQRSSADMKYAWYGDGENALAFSAVQDHQAASSRSRIEIRGVLDGHAEFSCKGLIKVARTAVGTIAEQLSKNLMLSKNAHVVTTPQLEIETNDVQCRHGAAISTLSEDQLFYLQGRGLTLQHARQMFVQGFLLNGR